MDIDDRIVRVRITERNLLVLTVVFAGLLKLLSVAAAAELSLPFVQVILGVAFLTFVPGLFVLLALDFPEKSVATIVCYAFGLSLVTVMVIGAVASLILPLVGISRIIEFDVLLAISVFLATIAAAALDEQLTVSFPRNRLSSPVLYGVLLLAPTSILGSALYTDTGNNLVLLGLLLTIGLIPVYIVLFSTKTWYYPLLIWSISLALLYHGQISTSFTITQPLPQLTMELGRWIPNYADGVGSLLPNGVLYPTYAVITGLPMAVEWNLVNPIIVSFLPVTLYETYRRHLSDSGSFLAVSIFVSAYSFYVLYPTAGRAATPVIFIALLGLAHSTDGISKQRRLVLLLCFGFGIAVSHYGTAYVVMFALYVGLVGFRVIRLLVRLDIQDRIPDRLRTLIPKTYRDKAPIAPNRTAAQSVLRPTYVMYFTVFALGWYLYTAPAKFSPLPKKILDALFGIINTQVTGSAASSFSQSYQAQAITISKYMYVMFGLLMALGFAAAAFELLVLRTERIETEYLAVGAGFFSMFIGSLLPSGNAFAVARVMMIIFVFAVPFAVIGVESIPRFGAWIMGNVSGLGPRVQGITRGSSAQTFLAVFIAMFLLLNTGFVSETVTRDVAPSNAVSVERLENSDDPALRLRTTKCTQCHIQSHLWVGTKIPAGETVFADVTTGNQLDYYAGTINSKAPNGTLGYKEILRNQTDITPNSFLILQSRNTELGGFPIGYKFYFYGKKMSKFTDGNHVYTSGYDEIYFEPPKKASNQMSVADPIAE